jgi:hypothetical protein
MSTTTTAPTGAAGANPLPDRETLEQRLRAIEEKHYHIRGVIRCCKSSP